AEDGSFDSTGGTVIGATLDLDAIHRIPAPIDITTLVDGTQVVDVCGDFLQPNEDDQFLVTHDATGQYIEIYVNGNLDYIQPNAAVNQINIWGAGGNDNLTVDSSNGLITVPGGIRYDGDHACPGDVGAGTGGFDRL